MDFLLITFINEKLPSRAVADWEALLLSKENEHKKKTAEEGLSLSWNPGSILNIKDFCVWLEAYATRNNDENIKESGSVFRVAKSGSKCLLHPDGAHSTGNCAEALSLPQSAWRRSCFRLKKCAVCLSDYSKDHSQVCSVKRSGLYKMMIYQTPKGL